jgi:phosphopantetheinyl transferase (holo-ACP synthase)
MIGNDLVDLQEAAALSNWRRKGYLQKLFTEAERDLIGSSREPDQVIWLLWSMKEAAYKIDSRLTGIRRFAPAALACTEVCIGVFHATGKVMVDQKTYFTESDVNEAYIHSIAAQSRSKLPKIRKEIYQSPLNCFDYKQRNPACVSHHGRYLALVF